MVVDARDDDLALEAGVLERAPAARARGPACRARPRPAPAKKKRCSSRASLRERVERREPRLDQSLPVSPRVDGEAPVEPAREDDSAGERLAKPRRQREPVLVVDRVLVLADEHGSRAPVSHFAPL